MIERERHTETSHLYGSKEDAWVYDVTYDLTEKEDIPFWIDIANQLNPNRILEIGTGTGRIAISLAEAGFNVVGIDIEKTMLDLAVERQHKLPPDVRQKLDFVQADARKFAFNQKFDLVIIPLNTFNHLLTLEEQVDVLRNIHDHLTPEKGVLAMDLFNPHSKLMYKWNSQQETPFLSGKKPLKSYAGVDPVGKFAALRLVYDYFNVDTDTFMVERLGFVFDLDNKGKLVGEQRMCVPMVFHDMFSILDPLSRAGFDTYQSLGSYEGYQYMDLACLTSGVQIKGTPSEKMIVITGPGFERVNPKPINPEIAEKLRTFY